MKNKIHLIMMISTLIVGIILVPSIGGVKFYNYNSLNFNPSGNTLYVGGSGPGNYTKIQDAIDNASDGNTIFVYSGRYVENLVVHKSIDLIGEDRNTTIIDGNNNLRPLLIFVDRVHVTNFTIKDSNWKDIGIVLIADHCVIADNIIVDCYRSIELTDAHDNIIANNTFTREWRSVKRGIDLTNSHHNRIGSNTFSGIQLAIELEKSENNDISSNIFTRNEDCLWMEESHKNNILGNTFTKNEDFSLRLHVSHKNIIINNQIMDNEDIAILIHFSQQTRIQGNRIISNRMGIALDTSVCTLIKHNHIEDNEYGVYLYTSYGNLIVKNNIFENTKDGYFRNAWLNGWRRNYWKPLLFRPKIIFGKLFKMEQSGWGYREVDIMTLIKCDWYPALKPYTIEV
jgi:parallel beta-helix repeat protein